MLWLTKWLNLSVKRLPLVATIIASNVATAQPLKKLSLEDAYQAAEKNFPLIKQKSLIKETDALTIKNLNTALWPQLNINGQATYQSAVTMVDVPLPGVKIPSPSKDQYRLTADVNQLIYDGGQVSAQRAVAANTQAVEDSRLDVEIFQLKTRISQIYFNILYQDALLKQTELVIRDVEIGVDKITAQLAQQTVLRSNLQVLQVQLLQSGQRGIEIKAMREGLTETLSVLTGLSLDENTVFTYPSPKARMDNLIERPELALYKQQAKLTEGQLKLINSKSQPKASVFLQGGYGRPGLNLLSNQFDFYYVAGLRLNWTVGSLYTSSRDRKLVNITAETIRLQQENFLLNTSSQLKQLKAEINKYESLVSSDQSIIALRNKISESAKVQLENAVITANDYLREINAADLARQALVTHQLQLLQAEINYQITLGKL